MIALEFVAGSESDGANSYLTEWSGYDAQGGGAVSCATARPNTGTYNLRLSSPSNISYQSAWVQKQLVATNQGRFGFYLYTDFTNVGAGGAGLLQISGVSELFRLQWVSAANLELLVLGNVVATWASQVVSAWHYISVDFKIDGSAGWVNVWNDGVLKMSFTGDTGVVSATVLKLGQFMDAANYGGYGGGNGLVDIDDFVFYDTTGETSAVCLPGDRFPWLNYTADHAPDQGFSNAGLTQFTPSSGSSQFAMVEECPDDGDTTYNAATAVNQADLFQHSTFMLPSGYRVVGVIPTMIARKTNAALATQISATAENNGAVTSFTSVQDLATSYAAVTASLIPDDPATGLPWTQAGVNAAFFGYRSEGVF